MKTNKDPITKKVNWNTRDRISENTDVLDISFMGANVSEWMNETYSENWFPAYSYYISKLKTLTGQDARIMLELAQYYNNYNDTSGVLVRGANYFDYRTGLAGGKNMEGINAKVFVDPNRTHSNIGFRYVIKVYRKDE